MYSGAFCRVYDEFGWNYYPQAFGEQLVEWLSRRGAKPARALDLGCGTGVLCALLAEHGIQASGIDLSEGMVRVARERHPGLDFRVADMTAYRPEAPVDLVTCTGDALNHLFDPEDLAHVFANVYASLEPGGLFVFDLLNEAEVPDGEPFDLDYSDTVRACFRTTREPGGVVNLNIRVFESGAQVVEEDIRERVHDVQAVLGRLRGAGFEVLQCADRLLLDAEQHGTTWFIAARRL